MDKTDRFNIKMITIAKMKYFVFPYGGETDIWPQPP